MFRSCCIGVLYLLNILASSVYSQKGVSYQFFIDQKAIADIFPKIRDTAELSYQLHQWTLLQQMDGYLLAGLDSITHRNDEVRVYLYKGSRYQCVYQDSTDPAYVSGTLSTRIKVLKSDATSFLADKFRHWVLDHADHGYPFAAAHFSPVSLDKDTLFIRFHLDKGELFTFGPVQQGNQVRFKNFVFEKICGIDPGALFSHSKIQKSSDRISLLANVQEEAEPFVFFPGNTCVVRYYLKHNKSSRFDFLLGLNPFDGPNGREYRFTGLGSLQLYNLFKLSEDISLKYENLSDDAPEFLLNLKFPYLPLIPLGLQCDLSLLRYREAYFEFKQQSIIEYPLDLHSRIGVCLVQHSSDLLNPDTGFLITNMRLPPILDFNYVSLGVRLSRQNLDHAWLPTRGYRLNAELHYGKKSYTAHPVFLEYESEQLRVQQQFDSLNLNDRQARFALLFENYTGLGRRSVFKLGFRSEGFLGNAAIVDNERFKLGGSQNLRGFDEDFYLASTYAIASAEFRYLLDRQSYLSLFHDMGFLKQSDQTDEQWNTFNGTGVGIHFTIPIGLFSLQYAIGSGPDISFNLGKGKIHFGFSALF